MRYCRRGVQWMCVVVILFGDYAHKCECMCLGYQKLSSTKEKQKWKSTEEMVKSAEVVLMPVCSGFQKTKEEEAAALVKPRGWRSLK